MTYTEQLEQESERARQHVAASLDELRSRVTPGQILDQIVGYARDSGGGDFLRNLKQQTVNNPLPIVLVGAGVGWLMLAKQRGSAEAGRIRSVPGRETTVVPGINDGGGDARESVANAAETVAETLRTTVSNAAEAISVAGDNASQAANSAVASVSQMAGTTRDAVSTAYGAVTEGMNRTTSTLVAGATKIGSTATAASRTLVDACREHPLILGGLGLAVGAAVGAALRSTEVENRLVGDVSDRTKETLRNIGSASPSEGDQSDEAAAADDSQTAETPKIVGDADDGETSDSPVYLAEGAGPREGAS